jgi:hypothetical protein
MKVHKVGTSTKVDQLIAETLECLRRQYKFKCDLTDRSYFNIATNAGFTRPLLPAAFMLTDLALRVQPITVRGLLYRGQAAGLYPDTAKKYYRQTSYIVLKLRRAGIMPFYWIADTTRRRLKPSSWSGLEDFSETAKAAYRKDFWGSQEHYIEVVCEKDAMAGLIEPITDEYDVYLNIIRGQVSETAVWRMAEVLKQIKKPIYIYYLGDHDPFGLFIEASFKKKLREFLGKDFTWKRLAVIKRDLANKKLIGFKPKRKSKSGGDLPKGFWKPYVDEYGERCIEVDALSPDVIRNRIGKAIESHIDQAAWQQLKKIEQIEKETLAETLKNLRAA